MKRPSARFEPLLVGVGGGGEDRRQGVSGRRRVLAIEGHEELLEG